MSLTDNWSRLSRPANYAIRLFVGGDGASFRRDITISEGGTPVDLTGVTPSAEISTQEGSLIVAMTATVTNAAAGQIRISLTKEEVVAVDWPFDGPFRGGNMIRGRWHLALEDGTTRTIAMSGEVTVMR